jgi:hypothetical protein
MKGFCENRKTGSWINVGIVTFGYGLSMQVFNID